MADEDILALADAELATIEEEIIRTTDEFFADVEANLDKIIEKHVQGPRKKNVLFRNRSDGNERLMRDYFVEEPVFGPETFRRRFRMSQPLFLRIMDAVVAHDDYFVQKIDACGQLGCSPHQKCTAAIRMLAYGGAADALDETMRMGASTILECMKIFCTTVIHVFGDEYERRPTAEDMNRLLHMGERRGFPGYIGSLDCMHWHWQLVDGIYPTWSRFVKTIPRPLAPKDKLFAKHQESTRKDVERAFGVLQSRWHIITRPARVWDRSTLANIMHTCIILHNMIVEEERDSYEGGAENFVDEPDGDIPRYVEDVELVHGPLPQYTEWLQRRSDLHDAQLHRKLMSDLVEHIWDRFSDVIE